jgi:hypothetical protein
MEGHAPSWPEIVHRLHADQRGTISIVSVFAVMFLAMLLGMVMNVGREVDDKVRMQNAADAAAYGGGVVLARGMNGLAFTNHLLFDVFAMTAFMREARDRNGEPYVPDILDAWTATGPVFAGSGFSKFESLGPAIVEKAPRERELVFHYSEWAAAASERILPVMEEILRQEMIPEYQRALAAATPDLAQTAAREVALRHSGGPAGRGPMLGVLWRSSVVPVGAASDAMDRTLPVVDPVWDLLPNQAQYLDLARRQRRDGAVRYLQHWNDVAMVMFDREAKMCQFSRLWRHFTCAALNQLLDEYATSNLPFLICTEGEDVVNGNQHLDQYFSFASVVYWAKTPQMLPGLFRDPIDGDALTYAQVRLFVPRRRIVWHWYDPTPTDPIAGNIGGHDVPLPPPDDPVATVDNGPGRWVMAREPGISEEWNLLNQHWTVQLVPATMPTLAEILQTVPPVPGTSVRLPSLGGLTTEDITRISPH